MPEMKRSNRTSSLTKKVLNAVGLVLLIIHSSVIASESSAEVLPKCLYVSSYHQGYEWSDGVEEGVRSVLNNKCELRQIDMDTKRKKTQAEKEHAAAEVVKVIEAWKPDVVITSDDNAAKYVIVPYYKFSSVPFVFSGVNWTVEEYGFPFKNVTGIVEVAPIEAMLQKAIDFAEGKNAIYLGADTLTEAKNFSRINSGAKKLDITLKKKLVSNFGNWLEAIEEAQTADFLVMGSNSGIDGWDEDKAVAHVEKVAKKLSVTNHAWMMGVTGLGFTKIPQEHGEWAAEAGLAILDGINPSDIPIVTNKKWELWVNSTLISNANIDLPLNLSRKAKRIASID